MIDFGRVANNILVVLIILGFFLWIILSGNSKVGSKIKDWFKGGGDGG